MLSISPVANSARAGHYFDNDNYYTKDDPEAKEMSSWWGNGAKAVGLEGKIEKEQFVQLLNGKMPTGEQLGVNRDGKILHRHGYDLTFSAPKSVSLLLEIGGDKRLLQAHHKAVETVLTQIEKEAASARVTRKGETTIEKTGNLIVAQFTHDASRALDPQLHTHAIVMNATIRQDGKVRALASQSSLQVEKEGKHGFMEHVYDRKMYFGNLYRAQLAYEITKLGYEVEKTHQDGRFEIKGVEKESLTYFSKRRVDIENTMKEQGLTGARQAAYATLLTRERKQDIGRDELRAYWQEQAKACGFFPEKMIEEAKEKEHSLTKEQAPASLVTEAVSYAKAHLGERSAAFLKDELEKTALNSALGQLAPVEVKEALEEEIKKGLIFETSSLHHGTLLTTPEAIALEKSNIEIMKEGRGKVEPIAGPVTSSLSLSQFELNRGQYDAAFMVLSTQDRVVGVQGYAGTGKTTLLKAVKEIGEMRGFEIKGIAPTGTATNQLREGADISSQTLESFLIEMKKKLEKEELVSSKQLWIVDESSMISSRQFNELLIFSQKTNSHLLVVGDKQQLAAVEAGKPFEQLQTAGMTTSLLDDIRRQTNLSLRQAVYDTIAGNMEAAFQKVKNNMIEIEGKEERLQKVASLYLDLSPEKRGQTLVVTPANADREKVNVLIRAGLQKEGGLGQANYACHTLKNEGLTLVEKKRAVNYEEGVLVKFNKDYKEAKLLKDEYYTVQKIDKEKNLITLTDGKDLYQWAPAKMGGGVRGAVEVYTRAQRQLSEGELIRWTRNDKKRRFINSETAVVKQVTNGSALVELSNKEMVTLNFKDKHHQHWDYAYAATAYAVQGKTAYDVIAHDESFRKYLTSQRGFYIILSRARENVILVVDNVQSYLKQLNANTGEKISALESLEQKAAPALPEKVQVQSLEKANMAPVAKDRGLIAKNDEHHYYDLSLVYQKLVDQAEHVVEKLLGLPNPKLSTTKEWRYGKKGSLTVTLQGERRGLWKNFENGEGGNLFQLIQRETCVNFKELLDFTAKLVGVQAQALPSVFSQKSTNFNPILSSLIPSKEDKQAMQFAAKLVDKSQALKGTVAERYLLEHRGIAMEKWPTSLRAISHFFDKKAQQTFPVLLAKATNEKGEVQGVQLVFLESKTGQKAQIEPNKKQFGPMKFGASVLLQEGDNKRVYVAEGVETGLSVAKALPNAKVLATLSVSNMKNVGLPSGCKEVVFCADNDKGREHALKLLDSAIKRFQRDGKEVFLVLPKDVNKDFNDVHKEEGIESVLKQLHACQKINNLASRPQIKQGSSPVVTTSSHVNLASKNQDVLSIFLKKNEPLLTTKAIDLETQNRTDLTKNQDKNNSSVLTDLIKDKSLNYPL